MPRSLPRFTLRARTATAATRRGRRALTTLAALTTAVAAVLVPGSPAAAAGTIQGIDVSHYQSDSGAISWASVKDGGNMFAIAKATEGVTYTDPGFSANYGGAGSAGMIRGAYHFARPDTSSGDAVNEANHFLAVAGSFNTAGKLPPVLDLETSGGLGVSALVSWTKTWLTTVQNATGRVPIIYTGPSFWQTSMGNSTAFASYPLWIAHYTTASSPTIPGGWSNYTFWQYTSSASVPGVIGNVDRNKYRGSSAALNKLALKSGVTGLVNTGGATLNTRSGPGTSYAVVGSIADGTFVTISCQKSGTSVSGTYGTTSLWDKLSNGQWVSDAYVLTGSSGLVAPAC